MNIYQRDPTNISKLVLAACCLAGASQSSFYDNNLCWRSWRHWIDWWYPRHGCFQKVCATTYYSRMNAEELLDPITPPLRLWLPCRATVSLMPSRDSRNTKVYLIRLQSSAFFKQGVSSVLWLHTTLQIDGDARYYAVYSSSWSLTDISSSQPCSFQHW